jgi:hypothetical protein
MASTAHSTQELTTLTRDGVQDNHEEQDFQSLPPADSGKDAYLFLAACVGLEALVWGFPFAVSWQSRAQQITILITATVRCIRSTL